ncbi:MAG: UDP-3-O-(3-hydroxymyristoyl)glucosamine N-acyltransferase [Phycisphaerae bacterium]
MPTLTELCEILQQRGMRPAPKGDPQRAVRGIATLEDALDGDLSFVANPKYERHLATTRASVVVLKPGVKAPDHLDLIQCDDPYAATTALIVALYGYRKHRPPTPGSLGLIAPTATIGENAAIYPGVTVDEHAVVGRNAVLYPGVYVGPRCRIGDDVVLYPNVVVYDDCILGNRVAIHAGTVVGNDGLGYAPVNGEWVKIPQIGIVEIEDDVEIGSNCSIDRATLGRTVIGRGSKLSNLIAIGHGTRIGAHCMLVAQVGLAGSVVVGEHVTMAGQVGVVGHIRVGDHARIGAKAGVTNDVPGGETYLGQPAIPIGEMRRQVAYVRRLPDMNDTLRKLEKRLAELESQLAATRADSITPAHPDARPERDAERRPDQHSAPRPEPAHH